MSTRPKRTAAAAKVVAVPEAKKAPAKRAPKKAAKAASPEKSPVKTTGKRKIAEVSKAAAKANDDDDDDNDDDDNAKADEKSEEKKAKVVVKGHAAVDTNVPGHANYHVYEQGSDVYDVMLNQTNIGQNNNKFYVIQLLESDKGGQYFTWNRWARVGLVGQSKLQPFGSNLEAAKKDFNQKFKDKTKNDWAKRGSFKPVPGKYTLIEIDYAADAEEPPTKKSAPSTPQREAASSTLPKTVQDLMNLIFDMKMMEQQMTELEFDCKKMPLGRLSKQQIKNGYEVLKEIDEEMKNGANSKTLSDLSSRFYTLIPHVFGMKVPPVIKTVDELKKKMQMLEALTDIEVAATMLKTTGGGSQIDANYAKLNCHIEPVDKSSEEYKRIEEYVRNTYANGTPPKIHQVYALERQGETDRFADKGGKIGNRKLLWHGSRLTNFVGILSQGLRIAPPEAPVSGYRFGKGLYFADMCSLSAAYCRSYGSPDFCMLLVDVAMGEPTKLTRDQFMEKPLGRTHSTLATGSEAPSSTHTMTLRTPKLSKAKLDLDVEVPLGKPKPTGITATSVRENQYIVYDVGQARLQYLLHLKN